MSRFYGYLILLSGFGRTSDAIAGAELPATLKIPCEAENYQTQTYDVAVSDNGRCLRIGSHDICEVQWLHKKWGKLDHSDLGVDLKVRPEFKEFEVVRREDLLQDGSKRASCRLQFVLKVGSRRVRCDYDHLTKDLAIHCPGSDLWRFPELQSKKKSKSDQ